MKEDVWEKVEAPSLKKKGGLRFKLSHWWDRLLRNIPRSLSCDNLNNFLCLVSDQTFLNIYTY